MLLLAGLLGGCSPTMPSRPKADPPAQSPPLATEQWEQAPVPREERALDDVGLAKLAVALEQQEQAWKRLHDSLEKMEKKALAGVEELHGLDKQLERELLRLAALQRQLAEDRRKADEAQRQLAEAEARQEKLRQHLKTLEQELARLNPGAAKKDDRRPLIQGLVKEVQPSGSIVISIGSTAGLKKGDTLEVYRLKPKPLYLGQIMITEVTANEAVARQVGVFRPDTIRPGDEASTKLAID
jgi:predicted RNase H-like nuclease (RuvC/YqgF family)